MVRIPKFASHHIAAPSHANFGNQRGTNNFMI